MPANFPVQPRASAGAGRLATVAGELSPYGEASSHRYSSDDSNFRPEEV